MLGKAAFLLNAFGLFAGGLEMYMKSENFADGLKGNKLDQSGPIGIAANMAFKKYGILAMTFAFPTIALAFEPDSSLVKLQMGGTLLLYHIGCIVTCKGLGSWKAKNEKLTNLSMIVHTVFMIPTAAYVATSLSVISG